MSTRRDTGRLPLLFALSAFGLGVVYTGLALAAGVECRFGERDVTLVAGAVVELSFAGFGWLLGTAVAARRRERRDGARLRAHLEEIDELRTRVGQQERLATLGQLAGEVAHEVRNPLAVIRSQLQNLVEALDDDGAASGPRAAELGRQLLEEVDRLSRVTRRLVDFARPLRARPAEVDPAELLRRTALLARPLLAARDLRLETETPSAATSVSADADLVCQLLLGLIDNAIAASPPGGTIRLAARAAAGNLELSVSDEGPGVPESSREKIFEPFVTTRPEGAGLGLALAREIASVHGGDLTCRQGPAGGACFVLQLPSEAGPP